MRPVKLMLEGFRSHHERTEICFEGRKLIAIVGATGAGKSSLLDGISYALYGKTPRQQSATKKLICSRSEEARVNLRFEVDGRLFEITRAMRRKAGPTPHVLVEVDSGEQVSGEAAVTERVTELLGLDFKAFNASVLLAQGEFDRFLRSAPTDRSQILKGVFRLEQVDAMRDAAKRRSDDLDGELTLIEGERRGIPEDLAERLADAKARHKEFTTRRAALETALPKEQELERRRRTAADDLERVEATLSEIANAASKLPPAETLGELLAQATSLDKAVASAEAACSEADDARSAQRAALEALETEVGREPALIELRVEANALSGLAEQVDSLAAKRKALDEDLEDLRAAAQGAVTAHKEAAALLESATLARRESETTFAAHALREHLVAGEPCPVCEQEVSKLPAGGSPTALEDAQRAHEQAVRAEKLAAGASSKAGAALELAEGRLGDLARDEKSARSDLERRRRALEKELGPVEDPLAEIGVRLERLREQRERVEAAVRSCESARDDLDRRKAAAEGFGGRRRKVAGALISISAVAGVDAPEVDDDMAALAEHARLSGAALRDRAEELTAKREATKAAADESSKLLDRLRAGLELEGATISDAMSAARSAADLAAQQRDDYELQRKRVKELDSAERELRGRRNLFAQLYKDFAPKGFVAFLLEERTRLLLELASERLQAMTDRYRMEMDSKGQLNVVDELDGEKRRTVDTLSGGETFLASLALALALADLVTREGGRLQSFFLDEGFGSLDADSLDYALTGIERIVSEDRLIGLVSHVPALRAKVDDQIELTKGPDGMSRVLRGDSLG